MNFWLEVQLWLYDPPIWLLNAMAVWWMLSLVLFPATLITAVVVGLWRGLRPDRRKLLRSARTIGGLLVFCLIPRLMVAPRVRPYPSGEQVLQTFFAFVAIALVVSLAGFVFGHAIRIVFRRAKVREP